MTHVLALDIGTSSVRARLYDERGGHVERAEARERYTETRGHSGRLGVFDAEELLDVVVETLDEARREAGQVEAVGLSCFWHSLVAVDASGRPLTGVLTWRDNRAAPEADELAARFDLHARTGCAPHSSYWPAKLLWLQRNEPDAFRSAHRFLSFADLVLLRLAGSARTSVSMASGTGVLRLDGSWDDELADALEVGVERLPEVSDEPEDGHFPAWGDGACSNVGAGCTTRSRAALMIGTSGAYRVLHDGDAQPRPGLFLYRADERRVVEGGSISDGGNLYDWLARTLRDVDPAGLADEPADGHGLTFLTLLGGERSPGWNAHARGAVTGLSFETTPRQLVHAALEGVAFRFAEIAERMPEVESVAATGAALGKNPDWTQILADVLGRPLELPAVDEASLRGAAVLALERLGESPAPPQVARTVLPREDRAETYRLARDRQRNLYLGAT